MILDLVIVALLALGLFIGSRTGFVTLLIGQISVLVSLLVLSRFGGLDQMPGGLAGSLVTLFAVGSLGGTLGARVARLIRRVPVLRGVDLVLGAAANAFLSLATIYVLLVGIVGLDVELTPLHRHSALGPGQVASLQARASADPALSVLVDSAGADALLEQTRIAPVPLSQLEIYEPRLAAYELKVRPQLVSSRLLPLILEAGEPIPLIGQHTSPPLDGPRDQPPSN